MAAVFTLFPPKSHREDSHLVGFTSIKLACTRPSLISHHNFLFGADSRDGTDRDAQDRRGGAPSAGGRCSRRRLAHARPGRALRIAPVPTRPSLNSCGRVNKRRQTRGDASLLSLSRPPPPLLSLCLRLLLAASPPLPLIICSVADGGRR